MKTSYVTYFIGVNDIEGVKTRRMLNAPVSMDFKHTLRSYMTRTGQDMRDCVRVERDERYDRVDVTFTMTIGAIFKRISIDRFTLESSSEFFANLQINKAVKDVIEYTRIPVKIALMREYNRRTLYCRTENRERFATATVKMA